MKKLLYFLKKISFILVILIPIEKTMSQDIEHLPFSKLPKFEESYKASSVAKRVIQGLGFRYYWGTHDLKEKDLNYRPSEKGMSSRETLEHIYSLSQIIYTTFDQKPKIYGEDYSILEFSYLRTETLLNLEKTVKILDNLKDEDIDNLQITFKSGKTENSYPFFYLLNGPIADALTHVGQVISFRRTSGNPIPKGVNVFMGIKN